MTSLILDTSPIKRRQRPHMTIAVDWDALSINSNKALFFSELSKAELAEENLQLKEQTREMRRKCAVIRDLIDVLQKNYESSKRLAFLHRYTVLKTMIKNIIHDNLV